MTDPNEPTNEARLAKALRYRDFVTVGNDVVCFEWEQLAQMGLGFYSCVHRNTQTNK